MAEITNRDVIAGWNTYSREAMEQHGDTGDFARQHLLNPALFALLSEVRGKQILDAGCGQGYLSRLLARKGAFVTGVEPAEGLYRYALEREQVEPLGITYVQADLSTLQGFRETFDAVVANMVFMDIPNYEAAMHNCIIALKQGGNFIFSITHPCFEESATAWAGKGYVEVREYLQEFTRPSTYGHWFHRPLSTYLNLVIREGCTLQRIIEPQLAQALIAGDAARERNVHVPQFLIVHATRV